MNEEKKIFVVDSQKLNTLQMCMKLYKYQFGESFEPATTPIHFEKGELIHHALEFYYKAKQVRSIWEERGLTHADIVQQAIQSTREYALSLSIDIEEVEDVIRVFVMYCEHYQNDGWNNIISVENIGTKLLYEDEKVIFLYEVKIDLSIGLSNLPLLPVDHKSFKRDYPVSDMSNQFMGYCWATETNNIIINRIGFYPDSSKKTLQERFKRETLSFTQARLDEWKENAIFWIRQGLAYMDHGLYPMNLTSCDKYSGCSFRSVCRKSPEDREEQLQRLYQIKEKEWDPGKKLEGVHQE